LPEEIVKVSSKIGHWLHFNLTEILELDLIVLKSYYKEALEIEKAYFLPKKGDS